MRTMIGLALAGAMALGNAAQTPPGELGLEEARALAAERQPLLAARAAAVRAARESAVAAAQLPDPMLSLGVQDLPANGPDRYSLRRDSDTQLMLGVKQSVPGGNKRALRGARAQAEAQALAAELDMERRRVRREAALAWLDAWKAARARALALAAEREAALQAHAVEIAYQVARASQADLLAARVARALLADRAADLDQQEWHARNQLRRWIGADAERPLAADLPPWTAPDPAALLAAREHHPHLLAGRGQVQAAQAELDLARAAYSPDWSVQLGYAYRPDFPEMASAQLELELPFFTGKRQDRLLEARRADLDRAERMLDDARREHESEVRLNAADWQRLQERLARYDADILPPATQRVDAALAAYRSGQGPLAAVLDARRSLVDVRMQRLELELDAARHQAQLQYFSVDSHE